MTLDLNFYENVIIYNFLKSGNEEYLASCIDYVDSSLFYDTNIGILVNLIKDFYLVNNVVPNLTEVKAKLINKQIKDAYIKIVSNFKTIDKSYSPIELVRNTETFIKQRLLHKCIEKSVEEKAKDNLIDESRTLKDLDKITSISLIDNLGMEFFNDTPEFCNRLKQQDEFISTGYYCLDRELGGGLFKEGKSIYCFSGETNSGKSIILGNITSNILKQGYNVVVITLEMSEFRYAKRIASILSGISQVDLIAKSNDYVEYVTNFGKTNSSRLFIKEFPTKQVSAKHIAAYIKKLERQKKFIPDVIVLDYHTLLKPSVSQGSKHADMQFTTQESRALSYVFSAPVLTVAQLNRPEGTSSTPGLGRIAGSWDMLSDMDYVIHIWQQAEDSEAEILRWVLKKARDSGKNVEKFWKIDYSTLRLSEDIEDEEISHNKEKLIQTVNDIGFDLLNLKEIK